MSSHHTPANQKHHFAGITLGGFIHWVHLRNERRVHAALERASEELHNRMEVQATLRRDRNFLDKLIESAPVIVLVLDEQGRILSYNPALSDVIGTGPKDLSGQVFFEDFAPPEDQEKNRVLLQDALTERGVQGVIAPVVGGERPRRLVEWYGRVLTDRHGKAAGGLLVGRDVTERVAEREKRSQLQTQLQQAQKMEALGSLAGGIAHDMNNILAAVMGFAALLVDQLEPGSDEKQDAQEIITAAGRGGALTRSLLALSRRHELSKQEVRLNEVVREVLGILERTIEKTIDIQSDLAEDLALVDGDPNQLSQTLLNLCINAAHAMEGGGLLTICTRNRMLKPAEAAELARVSAGAVVELQVKDTGVGIPAELLDRVVEPFFTTKGVERGSGLGLAMVYSTVKAHEGNLSFASQPGRGTTVTVLLPARSEGAPSDRPLDAAQPLTLPGRPTVLLIDDEEQLRKVGKRLLSLAGCEVLVADNGKQGLQVLQAHLDTIDLVILDMRMPVMDGPTCYAGIRALTATLPVLIATGFAEAGDTEEILAQGAVGVLHKPYTVEQLVEATRRAIHGA